MIVGFNIESLDGSRGGSVPGNLQVQYNPVIESVEAAEVSAMDSEVARIDFRFEVKYTSDQSDGSAAEISLSGNILWNGDTEEIVDHWEENNSLPDEVNAPLMNDMYRKCLSQAVGIADTLNLLPPIPTPTVDQ
ncbi:MAG: hypothetical protein ABEJ03_05225 [Candidatus Nanohaloarchaea archaeon]